MEPITPVCAASQTQLPGLLSPRDVVDLLGVSERTVRCCEDGALDRVRIGHRMSRYTRRSVLTLIDPRNDDDPAGGGAEVTAEGTPDARV